MANGKCIHCRSGITLHDDGLHRSLGWEVPCQRELTVDEERLMWASLRASTDLLYELPLQDSQEGK